MTARTASLGMYDRAELRTANDALWEAIAERLRAKGIAELPDRLDRERPLEAIWDDPDLLLAQTCGYPFMARTRPRPLYVATLCYEAPGCEGAHYRSRIVVRADEPADTLAGLRGRRAAVNDPASNSGMNLFRATIAPLAGGGSFFRTVAVTGSHAESARLVAIGGADIAAIDCVSYAHLERYDAGVTNRLRTLGWTDSSPGLPLITALRTTPRELQLIRHTLREVLQDGSLAPSLDQLRITGMRVLGAARYRPILALERHAVAVGYPILR